MPRLAEASGREGVACLEDTSARRTGEERAGLVFLPTQNKVGFVCVLSCCLGMFIWTCLVALEDLGNFKGVSVDAKCGPPQVAVATGTHEHHADPRAHQCPTSHRDQSISPSRLLSCTRGSPGVDEDGEQTPQGHHSEHRCQTQRLLVGWGQGVSCSEWLSPWIAESKAV